MASQVYFEGDFWEAVQVTAPGESPANAPDKWAKVEIPREALTYLCQAAYAGCLPGDGQNDKRMAEHRHAERLLEQAIVRASRQNTIPSTLTVMTR